MASKESLVVKSTKNGKGVFATKHFQTDEILLEFRGELFTYKELPVPYDKVEDRYVQVGKDLYMGPSGSTDDFLNHSCAPNAGLKIIREKVFLIAIQEIESGEEITWDYSTTMDEDDWEMHCKCGSSNCRGQIRDFKYLSRDVQKKYLDLGVVPRYVSNSFKNE